MQVIVDGVVIRCGCGASDLVLVQPGAPPVISAASDILVRRGVPTAGTCLACWPAMPAVAPVALR